MTWSLPTATTHYSVSLAPDRAGLVMDHWGDGAGEPWLPLVGKTSFETAVDVMPLEYSALGSRQVRAADLIVDHGEGLVGARFVWEATAELLDDGRVTVLTAHAVDTTGDLRLTLTIETNRDHDVVRKQVHVTNTGPRVLTLPRAFGPAWELPVGPGAQVDLLAGAWAREFTPHRVDLAVGELSIGSRQGITSHTYSPVVTVSARHDIRGSAATSDNQAAYGIALAWSGSWRMSVEAVPFRSRIRVAGGVDDESCVVTLEPGESFASPATLGVCAPEGQVGIRPRWHTYQRQVLSRSTGPEHRPIVYNSWYATEFDVDSDHQRRLAARARDLGVEVFVVDDGWFAGRTSDRAGLGDWTADPVKFPGGLGPLIDDVVALGMRFGLWVEPEAVNPDSDLFRAHPDWVYRAGDRPLVTVRNQHVLDFGRTEVLNWVEQTLRTLLTDHRISYLKWDMNRPVSDGGRPGDLRGRQWSVQHAQGYYRVLRMLREEFPHVTVEACSGGGGRIDAAVLGLSDVVWTSDETGPRDRLAIQHGFLSAYAPHLMSSWVTDEDDRLDTVPTSVEFRFVVAMAGVLGIGSDLSTWDDDRRSRAATLVALYADIRPLIHTGRVEIHGVPSDAVYVVEYGGGPEHGHRSCLLVYGRPNRPARALLRPRTLAAERHYRIRGQPGTLTGAEGAAGVVVPFALADDADVMIFEPVG